MGRSMLRELFNFGKPNKKDLSHMKHFNPTFSKGALGFVLVILAACNGLSVNNAEVSDLSWLKGDWKGSGDGQTIQSRYTELSGNNLTGSSYLINGQDTTGIHAIQISKTEGKLILSLRTQQNRTKIGYKLTSIADKQAVFKNEEADFPRTISYSYQKDTLINKWKGAGKKKQYKLVKR
jgi:hypothetical protein